MRPDQPNDRAAGAESAPIDETVLDSLRDLMADEFDDLVATYLEDADTLLENLGKALDSRDTGNLRQDAHSLKSCSANMGAVELSAHAKSLEHLAADLLDAEHGGKNGDTPLDDPDGGLETAALLFAHIRAEYARVRAALATELQT